MADPVETLQDAVRAARESLTPLAIVGNASKSFMGRAISAPALNVAGNAGIINYEPAELVITVRGGTTINDIEATLAGQGQCLAAEPPRFDGRATIAGTLACNLSGPARPSAGSIRDHILGLRLVNGRGEHLRFGGTVMKNVAGYDVSRLQAGAMGTLGIITEVTLRVHPQPQRSVTVRLQVDGGAAVRKMNEWAGRNLSISAACWHDGELSLRLSGETGAIESIAPRLGGRTVADGDAFWASVRDLRHPFFAGGAPLWRFSIRSSCGVRHFPCGFIDWGGAQRWLRGAFEKAALEAHAESQHGQVGLFRGGDRAGDVAHTRSPAQQAIHRRIKAAFDPDGVLNPGRLYSWM